MLNTTANVGFVLTQTGQTVTGTFSLGGLLSPSLTATVGADGSLALAAVLQDGTFSIDTTWTVQQPSAGVLNGQTRQVWSAAGQSGEGILQGPIISVTR